MEKDYLTRASHWMNRGISSPLLGWSSSNKSHLSQIHMLSYQSILLVTQKAMTSHRVGSSKSSISWSCTLFFLWKAWEWLPASLILPSWIFPRHLLLVPVQLDVGQNRPTMTPVTSLITQLNFCWLWNTNFNLAI